MLNSEQSNREALYYLAVSHRKNNNNDKAFATLEQLESLHPRYGRAFQEKGHNYLSINQPAEALTALEQAVDLNPAFACLVGRRWPPYTSALEIRKQASRSACCVAIELACAIAHRHELDSRKQTV
ncbi:MAG: tetratricopeptide repeat protein [Proteobacteria bacterium]|nr:tetratricopeptide repeat protein [Pseudomonadota bacterium]